MPDVDDLSSAANRAPVVDELTVERTLARSGAVPPVLDGLYVRNGPNPLLPDPTGGATWWAGDGMVHAVELGDGEGRSYRNRWVRTRRFAARAGVRPPAGPLDVVDGPANANALWHAGRLLALDGMGFPHRLTTRLATVSVEDFDGMVTSPVGARPRIDPASGALVFVGVDRFGPPFVRYHELDRTGELVHTADIEVENASYAPDFALSATRVVVVDSPAAFDPRLAASRPALPFRTDPEATLRLGVLNRGGQGEDVRFVSADPCLVHLVVNAFDDGDAVVLDVVCGDDLPDGPPDSTGGRLERWRVDPGARTLTRTVLDDRPVALCRVDDQLVGRPHRFIYGMLPAPDGGRTLVRYDLARGETTLWDPGANRRVGEPLFVRDPDGHSDEEGWVLVLVYDAERDTSDLVVLDASNLRGRPEAVVSLPGRVPRGLHGSWLAGSRLR